ncbi:MAG: hypothetical protein KDK91_24130 [Gammaproteobacteria bacterium]|nr:hypothetical protein [Gammaproteobacteria bacterium]
MALELVVWEVGCPSKLQPPPGNGFVAPASWRSRVGSHRKVDVIAHDDICQNINGEYLSELQQARLDP